MKNQRIDTFNCILLLTVFFNLGLFTNELQAFNVSPARWAVPEAVITFSDPDGTMASSKAPELKDGHWINHTKVAFGRWVGLDNVGFDIIYDTVDCGSTCSISNDKNEIYWMDAGIEPINLPANALAVTMKRYYEDVFIEVDIVVNKNFDKLNPDASGLCVIGGAYSTCYDYPSIITHEIGHLFGLDHSSEDPDLPFSDPRRQATMYYRLGVGGTLLPLKTDDKAGITCMYPSSTYGAPYKVPECCLSYNPFDRAPGCSHSFSGLSDAESLDSSSESGGCGRISSLSSGDGSNVSGPGSGVLYLSGFWLIFIISAILYRKSLSAYLGSGSISEGR